MTDAAYSTPRVTASGGPNPGMVALITLLLTLAGLIVGAAMSSGATLQSPFTSAEAFLARAQTDWRAMRVSAWLQVGSSVPLGIAAATLYARLQRLGVRVPGPVIALFGGIVAAVMLMLSGLVGWVLSRPEVLTTASVTQTLGFLWFMTGSVGFVLGIGLLVAGVAVPALILGLIPRWLALAGLVIAACAELSFCAMVVQPLQFLFPIGRFLGLLWLVVVGFLLPRRRESIHRDSTHRKESS